LGRNLHSSRDSRVKAIATGRSRIHHEHKLNQGVQACSRAVQVAFFFRSAAFFLPEIPLAAVHEIPSPNRSPTKLGAGKTVRPYCYNSVLCLHEAAPLRAARRKKKSRFPFALCSPGNSVAVDGSRKDQIRRRRSTARSDLPPVRTALLGPRHAVVPGAVGQRLQITGLREVRSLARFG